MKCKQIPRWCNKGFILEQIFNISFLTTNWTNIYINSYPQSVVVFIAHPCQELLQGADITVHKPNPFSGHDKGCWISPHYLPYINRCTTINASPTPCRNFSNLFLKTTRSVISVHILVLVSMRKYILNHK